MLWPDFPPIRSASARHAASHTRPAAQGAAPAVDGRTDRPRHLGPLRRHRSRSSPLAPCPRSAAWRPACPTRRTSTSSGSRRNRSSTTGPARSSWPGSARRAGEVVAFEEIPAIVIDAQTAIEDKTFWENAGFDPLAIISAGIDSIRGRSRGASTITQQLVRQRLLDAELVQDPNRQAERKLKEIIQSIRLTEAFPGVEGKKKIITAYMNQNYYGNQSYGIKAAAQSLLREGSSQELTLAEAAILAGLPKSPSNYDLVLNAIEECHGRRRRGRRLPAAKTKLVVPEDTRDRPAPEPDPRPDGRGRPDAAVQGQVSRGRLRGCEGRGGRPRAADDPALDRPALRLGRPEGARHQAVRRGRPTCDALDDGGLRITTTLDAKLQTIAEKWVKAADVVPNAKDPAAAAKALGLPYENWMKNLRGKDIHNGALVALDYQTGELIAYVGSADYYSTKSTPKFQPKFDVVGSGWRQPGSAFKPFNYLTGIDDRIMTAGSMFMDSAVGLRRRLHAGRRRQPRARPGPRPDRPPVLAQHPVGQGGAVNCAGARVRPVAGTSGCASRPRRRRPGWRSRSASRRSARSIAIVIGKLLSALTYVFILIGASIPLTAMVFVFGGVGPDEVPPRLRRAARLGHRAGGARVA